MTRCKSASFAIAITALLLLAWPAVAQARVIERVSISSAGTQANDWNDYASVSGDGRYVAFQSAGDNLVADDTNDCEDIFVRDRQTGTTVRVSLATDGTEGNGPSTFPSISADGAWVAFTSAADNLVTGDTNGVGDVFLYEMATGVTTRISVAGDGTEGNDESGNASVCVDGSVVAFSSYATNLVAGDTNYNPAAGSDGEDIFVWVRATAVTERVSVDSAGVEGDSDSYYPCLSADSRFVAFSSDATDLVTADTNEAADIFVRDRTGGTTERVSVANDEAEADDASDYPSISADGRYVAFDSPAGNLVAGDTNYDWDVFVRDRTGGTTTRVSVSSAGGEGNLASMWPSISGDGRYVVFESYATDLVSGDTNGQGDVYLRDRTGRTTVRLSTTSAGTQGNDWSGTPVASADGRYVAFESWANNLITPDSNSDASDVFVVINPATTTYDSYRGSDRYDTAIKLSKALYPAALPADSGLVLAPGETFPEALCGAPLAAAYGGPVLLTYKTTVLPNNVRAELQRLAPKYVFCIGLSSTAVNSVIAAMGPTVTVTPITGADVYTMSRNVANALKTKVGDMSTAVGIVTRGDVFPDAIGVSPLACAKLWPIILTNSGGTTLHAQAAATMADLGLTQTLKVGTYATMPGGVTALANLSGTDRYVTNANVANWAKTHAGLTFTHTGLATGDKFPDGLASGPFLGKDGGLLLLSPLNGALPASIGAVLRANAASVYRFTFIAMIEPVVGQAKALLP